MEFSSVISAILPVVVKIGAFEVNIYRIIEFLAQVFGRFSFLYIEQVHDFQDTMRHAACSGYGNFNIGQFHTEIGMDEFAVVMHFPYPAQLVRAGTVAVGHNAVVRAHDAGKKAEANDALTVFVF